ncbi:putative protein C22orf31 [Dissostichus eleginoides]|uniref:Uncharacterized protein n=1 Tax=Dissostichus eleginoides TaxID=100907 RepID=A0AAD9ERL8_DISEL|nr:putative protein C22orf31 [Dissostichus eleginoides]
MSVCCCSIECPSSRRTTRQEGESLPARGGLQSADSVPAAGTTRSLLEPDILSCFADLLQVPHTKRRRPAASADLPQKRKQTSAALPPKPADLPPASNVAPRPQTSTAPLHLDNPIRIHNRSLEEYQLIYHEVVDNMLRFPNGRLRPYSLGLGRRIKQKLWERLDRPMFTETVDEDGLVHVDVSYGAGVQPPLYNVDVSGEPEPEYPPAKRAKH